MKLNVVEKALMNNPVRAFLQKHYEVPLLKRLGECPEQARVLEIGCGRGVGTEIIFSIFGARKVHAFDVDPDMVERAQRRLSHYSADRLRLYVGDAAAIDEEDEFFDAVFDFGIIHHVPEWQSAIAEVARVLRPGGLFFYEEVTSQALNRWSYRTFLEHPADNRFSKEQFLAELKNQGILTGSNVAERFFGDFIFGVGRRSGTVQQNTERNH